jgi:branched-subunit amino acid aminotransferase/4-amino-4-deoxychorismate lyase
MPEFGEFFCFESGQLISRIGDAGAEVKLAVADSWLVEDGKVRDLEAHFSRFERWVTKVDQVSASQLSEFFEAVRLAIPLEGRWFPRIELHAEAELGSRLYLRLREAPALNATAILWTNPEADSRSNPSVKGPDLSLGMQMRRAAQMHGADEAVILNSDGYVAEGALSSLVWWREDVLCAPGSDIEWLESITRDKVFAIAESMGLQTNFEAVTPEELAGLEIWSLSSLQGIRLVTDWIDLEARVGQPKYFDSFAKRLRLLSGAIR